VKRYVENLEGYIVAGRRVKTSLGVATFAATEMGTITFMYFGELGYLTGFSCFVIGVLGYLSYYMVGRTGFIVSKLRAFNVLTIPHYYELRYGKGVRLAGGIILFLGGILNMGIFLKFDGIFLTEVMGLPEDALILIMVLMLVVVVGYTILGGMFSVVITDFMQYVVLSMSMLAVSAILFFKLDWTQLAMAVDTNYGRSGFDPIFNDRFGWMFIVWVFVSNLASASLWQPGTSKALSSESPKVARSVFRITGMTFAGRAMIPMLWGIIALAVLGPGVDSVAAMPRMLGMMVPVGFLGLLVAGMMAASMSTYSSYLLAWSSVFTLDIVGSSRKKPISDKASMTITRVMAALIGVFLLIFGLWYELPETAYQYLFITGAMYTAGALGCVTAGLYWKKANSVGAMTALLAGALAPLGFLFLEQYRDVMPSAMLWVTNVNVSGLLSFVLAAAGMIIGSLLTQKTHPPTHLETTEG
jgi:SSS family solute:Na+ symporter